MRQLPAIVAALGAAGAVGLTGCADDPTRAAVIAPDREAPAPFTVSVAERAELQATLLFAAGEYSKHALSPSDSANEVGNALAKLAARVGANDRTGAERDIAAARAAVGRLRDLAGTEHAISLHLDAMSVALQYAEGLAHQTAGSDAARTAASTRSPAILRP